MLLDEAHFQEKFSPLCRMDTDLRYRESRPHPGTSIRECDDPVRRNRGGYGSCLLLLISFAHFGCQKEQISYYEVPREERPTTPGASQALNLPPDHPDIAAASTQIAGEASNPKWSPPEHWLPGPPSQLRRASFSARGQNGQLVDISITTFPGQVGGALANINRWRRQIGLDSVDEEAAGALTNELEIRKTRYKIIDISNKTPPIGKDWPQSSLIATTFHNGNSWFFKMSGDTPLVDEEREAFMQFLESVRF